MTDDIRTLVNRCNQLDTLYLRWDNLCRSGADPRRIKRAAQAYERRKAIKDGPKKGKR